MYKKCAECGRTYYIRSFRIDGNVCRKCIPSFLSMPLWLRLSPGGTSQLWMLLVAIHFTMALFLVLLLDCGVVSVPGGIYCIAVIAYFGVRMVIASHKGYPTLTRLQQVALLLLPVYGLVGSVFLFHWVQELRYGM